MRFMLGWELRPKLDDGLEARPKAIGEDLKSSPFFMPWPRMGLTRVMRWPKNNSYSKHISTIKSILQ